MNGMAKWLIKSEPDSYSIDDLKRDKKTRWDGVRNYQASNYLKAMAVGDELLFYHSSAEPTGVVGLAKVSKVATPEEAQFDKKSKYYDPDSSKEEPRWFAPEVSFVKAFKATVTIGELRAEKSLAELVLLKRGSRLSVHPVTEREFAAILKLAGES